MGHELAEGEFAGVTGNEYLCIKLTVMFFEIFLTLLAIIVGIPLLVWLASIVLPILWEMFLICLVILGSPFMIPVGLYKRWRRWYDRRQRRRRRMQVD